MEETNEVGISIIIPTYKPKEYLYKCLKSICSQFTIETENCEVIVILNGEKEPYYEKILLYIEEMKEIIKNDSQIKLIYTNIHGVSNARNLGLEYSEKNFILFIDDDDSISKDFIKEIQKILAKNLFVDLIITNTICEDKNSNIFYDYLGKNFKKLKKYSKFKLFYFRKQFSNSCGKIINKKILKGISFDERVFLGEDSLFMSKISKNIFNVELAKESIYYIRNVREGSSSRQKIKTNNKKILIKEYWKLLNLGTYNKIFIISRLLATIIKK